MDEPICLIEVADNNAVYYYHFDGLGSVVALSDVNSVLVERYTYDVFGRPTIRDANGTEIADSACGNPYLFTGRAWDGETALYYYRARSYDYATARFLQPDPIGYADGLNLYTYVHNNAVNHSDPSGQITSAEIMVADTLFGLQNEQQIRWTAGMIYSEIGWWRPRWCKGATTRTYRDYDPASVQQLQRARVAVGHVHDNRMSSGRRARDHDTVNPTVPTQEQLADEAIRYGWQQAVEAASVVALDEHRGYDPTDGSLNFYLRVGGLDAGGLPVDQPPWARGVRPYQSIGPFRNIRRTGDVEATENAHVDVYRGIP
jgi:RHS repeat-associated protein